MLRLAAWGICRRGLMLDATIHDAVLIEADAAGIADAVEAALEEMGRASEVILGGLRLRAEAEVIAWPARYRDARGAAFFEEMIARAEAREGSCRPWMEGPCRPW